MGPQRQIAEPRRRVPNGQNGHCYRHAALVDVWVQRLAYALASPHAKLQMMQRLSRTVLMVLGEIPLSKLLEVFHQELICSLTNCSVGYHHVKGVKSAVENLEFN
jgi:hypothetical protein